MAEDAAVVTILMPKRMSVEELRVGATFLVNRMVMKDVSTIVDHQVNCTREKLNGFFVFNVEVSLSRL
jgi:hypothetical protein